MLFNIFVLRNFIEDLPRDLFEAAEMDGASHWQQIRHIVVPLSSSIIGRSRSSPFSASGTTSCCR